MNNSKLTIDSISFQEPDVKPRLQEREQKLLHIIEAIGELKNTKAWSTLKTELFDSLSLVLRKELLNEAKKEDPSPSRLNRLSGELKWADKFADLTKLESGYKSELSNVRKLQHEHG